MTPFFFFLFIGVISGLMTGMIRHDDWLDRFADIEMGILGAIIGGMTFVLVSRQMESVALGGLLTSFVSALLFLTLLKRVIYQEPKSAHR